MKELDSFLESDLIRMFKAELLQRKGDWLELRCDIRMNDNREIEINDPQLIPRQDVEAD